MRRFFLILPLLAPIAAVGEERSADGLIGRWLVSGDASDRSGSGQHGEATGVRFVSDSIHGRKLTAARFDGIDDRIAVKLKDGPKLGTASFSLSVWVHTESKLDDVLGDIVSQYDAKARRGFHLSALNHAGVTSSQSNDRQLLFGIDDGKLDQNWTDCGRPGNGLLAFSMAVHRGDLFVGTFEIEAGQRGRVFRYAGSDQWEDCEIPVECNTIGSLAVLDGHLYAGSDFYRSEGSALPPSPNQAPGGKVYRYEGDHRWTDLGRLENAETGAADTVGGLVAYNGELYAGVSKPPGRGFYKYADDSKWQYCGNPGHRVTNPIVFNGHIYLASLDGGGVVRYDGPNQWTSCGKPEGATQTYGFAIHRGELYVATWPKGEVWRYSGGETWTNIGRLGQELEVMGMSVYNGALYAGTLPLAQVYRFDSPNDWKLTGRLDHTPDVKYRRAWSMAVFGGKLYCSTLPSGRIYSIEAGKCATYDHALPTGWVHLAAVRGNDRLSLYVNGKQVARSSEFLSDHFNLSSEAPLEIGFGAEDYFKGRMHDLRLYRRALREDELKSLASGAGLETLP